VSERQRVECSCRFRNIRYEIGSIVPLGRGYLLMIPGSSCLATIALSLRDKNHFAHRSAWH
jgi:hypothetical protein